MSAGAIVGVLGIFGSLTDASFAGAVTPWHRPFFSV
jgi:hypothetical protein